MTDRDRETLREFMVANNALAVENHQIRECLSQTQAERDLLRNRIEAVVALHERYEGPALSSTGVGSRAYCVICTSSYINHRWPCPTVKALKGERWTAGDSELSGPTGEGSDD